MPNIESAILISAIVALAGAIVALWKRSEKKTDEHTKQLRTDLDECLERERKVEEDE